MVRSVLQTTANAQHACWFAASCRLLQSRNTHAVSQRPADYCKRATRMLVRSVLQTTANAQHACWFAASCRLLQSRNIQFGSQRPSDCCNRATHNGKVERKINPFGRRILLEIRNEIHAYFSEQQKSFLTPNDRMRSFTVVKINKWLDGATERTSLTYP